jgi:hypothetical protein
VGFAIKLLCTLLDFSNKIKSDIDFVQILNIAFQSWNIW